MDIGKGGGTQSRPQGRVFLRFKARGKDEGFFLKGV